jgi:hypothetical protein
MNTWKTNLHYGTLKLHRRGRKGTFWLDIHLKDIEDNNRFRVSTGTNELKLAKPVALKMVADEHKRRVAGTTLKRKIQPQQYLQDVHIPWLQEQEGIPLDNKPNRIMSAIKITNNVNVLKKWFVPFIKGKRWEHIQTSAFGRSLVEHFRKNHIMDSTISSYLGIFNRMMRRAEEDAYIQFNHLQGVPALAQGWCPGSHKRTEAYAVATDDMIFDLMTVAKAKVESEHRKDWNRTYTQAYAFLRILADTGFRPYTKPPLNFDDFVDDGDIICIDRKEKGKRYDAQGGSWTREALDDLRKLYLSEGTNVKARPYLPIIHHAPCGNKYGSRVVQPYTQIGRINETMNKLLKLNGWYDMNDRDGRKFRLYSIRKWHINKSISEGEDRFQIADRVGHTYAVLERFYLDRGLKQKKKSDIRGHRNNINERTV